MKVYSLFIFLLISDISAGVVFTSFPRHWKLYARDPVTDSANVIIKGIADKLDDTIYSELRVNVYRENVPLCTLSQELKYTADTVSFNFSQKIKAELANYQFRVYGVAGGVSTPIDSAFQIVAGDVYVIQGQSNAEAYSMEGSAAENNSPFIRVFGNGNEGGSPLKWFVGQGDGNRKTNGNTGQWGLRLAKRIVDNQKIPVSILNGAHGGMIIQFFTRNDSNPTDQTTNYGRLLKRVNEAGLNNGIRGVIWHQGESNWGMGINEYKEYWVALHKDWLKDYPSIEKTYIFQIRNGCYSSPGVMMPVEDILLIKEAHRQLAEEIEDVEIMSTSGEVHYIDNCHYTYGTGYKLFGNHIYGLIARDLYGVDNSNVEAPQVDWAEITGTNQITLYMKNKSDTYLFDIAALSFFEVTGANITVTSPAIDGHKIMLNFSGPVSGVTAISFKGTPWNNEPMVINNNGIGAVHFSNLPVYTPFSRDSSFVRVILDANNRVESVESISEKDVNGHIISLDLSDMELTQLPPEISQLSYLTALNLNNNLLTTLPLELTRLIPDSLNVNGNKLCELPDTVETWVNENSVDSNWKISQQCVTGIEHKENFSPFAINIRSKGKEVCIRLLEPQENVVLNIVNLQGKRIKSKQFSSSQNLSTWTVNGLKKGIYLLQTITEAGTHSIKFLVL
ncbi:MAG: T9SS type A sorting domain-containing protein [Fibrobacteria bacterium]|nr:T9SS type A sorting domain-containing protein [Fibrobacteria bacterium]